MNGIKNGKGKEYDYEGNLEFDGEYLNGKKWNGKEYENFYAKPLEYEITDGERI